MQRVINFKENFGEYQDGTPYIIAANDQLSLAFDFSNNTQKPKRLKAVYAVGAKKSKIFDVSDFVLQIPYSFLDEALNPCGNGALLLELHEFTDTGFEINEGRYKVEPLCVTKIHNGIEGYGLIQSLKNQMSALANSVDRKMFEFEKALAPAQEALEKALNNFQETLKANKKATLKYLYRHYTQDLRDSDLDLPLEKFAQTLGFDVSDLSKEELKEIDDFKSKEGIL